MQNEEKWKFSPRHISQLLGIWAEVSAVDGTISEAQLNKLVRSLHPPVGTGPDVTRRSAKEFLESRHVVAVRPGRYTFEHTVFALVAGVTEVPLPQSAQTDKAERQLAAYFLAVCLLATGCLLT